MTDEPLYPITITITVPPGTLTSEESDALVEESNAAGIGVELVEAPQSTGFIYVDPSVVIQIAKHVAEALASRGAWTAVSHLVQRLTKNRKRRIEVEVTSDNALVGFEIPADVIDPERALQAIPPLLQGVSAERTIWRIYRPDGSWAEIQQERWH